MLFNNHGALELPCKIQGIQNICLEIHINEELLTVTTWTTPPNAATKKIYGKMPLHTLLIVSAFQNF